MPGTPVSARRPRFHVISVIIQCEALLLSPFQGGDRRGLRRGPLASGTGARGGSPPQPHALPPGNPKAGSRGDGRYPSHSTAPPGQASCGQGSREPGPHRDPQVCAARGHLFPRWLRDSDTPLPKVVTDPCPGTQALRSPDCCVHAPLHLTTSHLPGAPYGRPETLLLIPLLSSAHGASSLPVDVTAPASTPATLSSLWRCGLT